MSNLEIYNQRLSGSGQRVLAHALNGARRRGQNYVVVEHFIEALVIEEGRFFNLLAALLGTDLAQIQTLTAERLESFPQQAGGKLRLAPAAIALLKHAWELARNDHRPKIEAFDLIIALARDERGLFIELLKGLNADVEGATATLRALDYCTLMLSHSIGSKQAEGAIQMSRVVDELIFIPKKAPPPRTRLVKRRRG